MNADEISAAIRALEAQEVQLKADFDAALDALVKARERVNAARNALDLNKAKHLELLREAVKR